MKKNAKKWKKWKNETKNKEWKNEKNEKKMKKMKKNRKNGEKWWKKKEKWKNGFTRKFLDGFQVYRCCCNFFSSKSSTISMILFRNVFSQRKSTTRFGGRRFSQEKWQFSVDVKTNTHNWPTKINEKKNR